MTIFRWLEAASSMKRSVTSAEPMPGAREVPRLDLTSIHERHADFVWRTLQRLGVRPMDLEDSLQDVFVVVHRRLGSFDGSSQVTTWLFAICLRVAAAHRRRAHVRREQATDMLEATQDPDPQASPERLAIEREARARLDRVLDTLELDKRAVFVMFELEGMSAPVIASTIGVPVGTVYSRLAAARGDFKKALVRFNARRAGRSVHG
jgi:RNA polymerase sigma-70 factor (ECF subfamily)